MTFCSTGIAINPGYVISRKVFNLVVAVPWAIFFVPLRYAPEGEIWCRLIPEIPPRTRRFAATHKTYDDFNSTFYFSEAAKR